ncbi:MAG TPA: peptidase C39 family protein [Herpetosiphonaceae bacterium]
MMPALPPWLLRWQAAADPSIIFDNTRYISARGVTLSADAREGALTGPPCPAAWTKATPSWSADAPVGTSITVLMRADLGDRWTNWYALGEWSSAPELRHSIDDQSDADGEVATDTLLLRRPAQAIQWRVVFRGCDQAAPVLRSIAIALDPVAAGDAEPVLAPIAPLPVPERSQMVYPNGGPVWCSPTSLTMLLAYWAERTKWPQLAAFLDTQVVPEIVAPAVYDSVYEGTGNWPFNTAYAATLGLEGYVVQLGGLGELAPWLAAGVPLVASIAWQPGDLDGAAVGHSNGHLVVVVGIGENGDVIVNDPAADPRQGESVRRSYPRAQFSRAWQRSGRTVYLVYPPAAAR